MTTVHSVHNVIAMTRPSSSFLQGGFLVLLLVAVAAVHSQAADKCDKFKMCKGPIRHYEDLHCKPVYEKDGDCCAASYDCSHLNNRSLDKCYVNGHEYAIGENIRKEDRPNDCDTNCSCHDGNVKGVAEIICATLDCAYPEYEKGSKHCYIRRAPGECCGTKVCPKTEEEIKFKCEVEGKIYMDGQEFYPTSSPDMVCNCLEGYKGENVAPFCRKPSCGTEMRHSDHLRENCAPVFYDTQNPRTDCSVAYRCQNDKDAIVHPETEISGKNESKDGPENMTCKFGNMTMHVGDQLEPATDYSSVCVKCVCEVPPTPTCQRLPDSECDITKHPKFD